MYAGIYSLLILTIKHFLDTLYEITAKVTTLHVHICTYIQSNIIFKRRPRARLMSFFGENIGIIYISLIQNKENLLILLIFYIKLQVKT